MTDPYVLLSMPDMFNGDVGDLRDLPDGWELGKPNSWNSAYQNMVEIIFTQLVAERPVGVLVTGDLFEAHWGQDVDATGVFGPSGNADEKTAAMRRAYRFYSGFYRRLFANRELMLYPCVGDHELLDNPWHPGTWHYDMLNVAKAEFSRAFTRRSDGSWRFGRRPKGTYAEGTSYAVRLPSEEDWNTLLVTGDVFRKIGDGSIKPDMGPTQLDFMRAEIADARAERPGCWVIVQEHVPVIAPVRAFHSSNIRYDGGTHSAFWALLKELNVDLLLCGEVHDMTTRTYPADTVPVQICHGAIPCWGNANYLRMAISDGRIDAQLKLFHGAYPAEKPLLWQTSSKRPPAQPNFVREPYDSPWWSTPTEITYMKSPSNKQAFVNRGGGDAGSMTLDRSSGETTIAARSERLAEYQPETW
jgi:hypothetical protein